MKSKIKRSCDGKRADYYGGSYPNGFCFLEESVINFSGIIVRMICLPVRFFNGLVSFNAGILGTVP